MSQTIIEKILSAKSGQANLQYDDRVWIDLDLVTMRDFGGPNAVVKYQEEFSEPVFNPDKVAFTFDVQVPAKLEANARNQKICRDFAQTQGINKLFDINQGIGQHVLFEKGLIAPGNTVIGTDSHMNLLGAVGCFATGVGTTDIVGALRTGKIWIRVPHTAQITLKGRLASPLSAKDIVLALLKQIGEDGGINTAFEFSGSYAFKAHLHEALTITSMITEMGGVIGFFYNNPLIMEEITRRNGATQWVVPDAEAEYTNSYNLDLDQLTPMIACPHSPANVKPVSEVEGIPLNQVFIGSCTNGRFEDLQIVAKILRGKKVHSSTRLIIVPASTEVAKQSVQAGLYQTFLDAGAVICNPGCSLCTTGHYGVLAPEESALSTGNRNFIGKVGKGSQVYLASPATAAVSAITGKITDPSRGA